MLLFVLGAVSCKASGVPALTWTKHPAVEEEPSKTLVLMLPGVGDDGETYVRHGFVQRLQASRAVDVVTIDAYRQYFGGRTLLARVEQDVLVPARQRGYAQIWIVGISVGGTGALLTARHFENDIDGLVLFAPYLGHARVIARIVSAGGIQKWKPPARHAGWTVDLWRWLQGYTRGERRPIIYLAAGTEDIWAHSHRVLAEVVPPEQVFSCPGGHAWKVWSPLWTDLLDAGAIATPPVVSPAVDDQRARPNARPPTTPSTASPMKQ
jgi:alpha-beta hydrolase superfamily lysophospholipase